MSILQSICQPHDVFSRTTDVQTRDDADNLRWTRIRHSESSLVRHHESRLAVILVADFINFFLASCASIKSVWAIDHNPVKITYIFIGMHDAFGDQHYRGIVLAHNNSLPHVESRRVTSIVPHAQFEI